MNRTFFRRVASVCLLSTMISPAMALRADLQGSPAPVTPGSRMIQIGPDTRYVNVTGGEVVNFVVGGRTFAWQFAGGFGSESFDLRPLAPEGSLQQSVRVYVAPNPLYVGE